MSRTILALLAVLSLAVPRAWAVDKPSEKSSPKPSPLVVEYREDKLTLRAHDTPVADVLDAIKHQSGAEIRGQTPKVANVTAEFDAVPLAEALQRMLGENFTLRYGSEGLKTIELKGGPEEAVKVPTVPPPVPIQENTTPEVWRRAFRVFEGAGRVPVKGKFAQLIAADEAKWDMVMNMSYGYLKEAKVRTEAVRAGLAALENNPELRQHVVDTIVPIEDAELARLALHTCKHMCEEMVKNVIRNTRDREIRTKAIAVLRQIRTMPKPAPFYGS